MATEKSTAPRSDGFAAFAVNLVWEDANSKKGTIYYIRHCRLLLVTGLVKPDGLTKLDERTTVGKC